MAVTRAQIRTRARIRADQDQSTFPDDTQYNFLIDEAGQEVWFDLWAAGFPLDFTSTSITANGSTTYPLNGGANIMAVQAVYLLQGSEFFLLRRADQGNIASLRSLSGANNGNPGFYEVRVGFSGPVVEFLPKPTSGQYRVDHVPEWPGFSADGDFWRGPARSDELVVIRAAEKGAGKEGPEGTAGLRREYDDLYQKVVRTASWFDQRNTARIRDVETMRPRGAFEYNAVGPYSDY